MKRQHWRQLQWHRTNHEYEPHPACGMVLAHQLQTYARRDASDDDNWHFHGQSRLWVSCVAQRVRSSLSLRFVDDSDCIVKHACDPSPWLWCRLAHLTPLVPQANAAHELYLVRGSAKCHVNACRKLVLFQYLFTFFRIFDSISQVGANSDCDNQIPAGSSSAVATSWLMVVAIT